MPPPTATPTTTAAPAAGDGEASPGWSRAASFAWVTLAYLVAAAAGWAAGRYGADGWHPVLVALAGDAAATAAVFAFSFAFGNSSFYDAYWSVAPPVVTAYWMRELGRGDALAWLVLGVVLLWAARLTHNWARGWTGLAHEDWRYGELARKTGAAYWLVSFAGIHMFPTLQVFACLVPVYAALEPGAALNAGHSVGLAASAAGVLVEHLADTQLRRFARRPGRGPGECIDEGLWRYSRHPNYFGEALFWAGLWLVALASDARSVWTLAGAAGPASLAAMFVFVSIPMMEERLLERRPDTYPAYRRRVAACVPWPRRGDTLLGAEDARRRA